MRLVWRRERTISWLNYPFFLYCEWIFAQSVKCHLEQASVLVYLSPNCWCCPRCSSRDDNLHYVHEEKNYSRIWKDISDRDFHARSLCAGRLCPADYAPGLLGVWTYMRRTESLGARGKTIFSKSRFFLKFFSKQIFLFQITVKKETNSFLNFIQKRVFLSNKSFFSNKKKKIFKGKSFTSIKMLIFSKLFI